MSRLAEAKSGMNNPKQASMQGLVFTKMAEIQGL